MNFIKVFWKFYIDVELSLFSFFLLVDYNTNARRHVKASPCFKFISRYSLNQSNFQAEDLPRSEANHTGDNNHKKHEYKNVDSLNP